MKSLLEQAREIPYTVRNSELSNEELELIQAWLDNKISSKSIRKVMKLTPGRLYSFLALGCKQLYKIKQK